MVQVKGKWALITGASRGIGNLTAKFMAEQGCNLILHSRNKEHCEKLLEEVKDMGVEACLVQAELSDLDSVRAMLDEIDGMGMAVDIVLNNAGMQIAYRTDYYKTPVSDYTESFKIKYHSACNDMLSFYAQNDRAGVRKDCKHNQRYTA